MKSLFRFCNNFEIFETNLISFETFLVNIDDRNFFMIIDASFQIRNIYVFCINSVYILIIPYEMSTWDDFFEYIEPCNIGLFFILMFIPQFFARPRLKCTKMKVTDFFINTREYKYIISYKIKLTGE